MPESPLELPFPLQGVTRRWSHAQQPPQTTPAAENVRPDSFSGRTRGGIRPGLKLLYPSPFGGFVGDAIDEPVRLLGQVRAVSSDATRQLWSDDFSSYAENLPLTGVWSDASWKVGGVQARGPEGPGRFATHATQIVGSDPPAYAGFDAGSVRAVLADLDATQSYTVSLDILSYFDFLVGEELSVGEFSIWIRMDNTTPNVTTGGVEVKLRRFFSGNHSIQINVNGSLDLVANFSDANDTTGLFEVQVDGNDITVRWRGTEYVSSHTVLAPAGTRIGFGLDRNLIELVDTRVDTFAISYGLAETGEQVEANRTYLVAGAGDNIRVEDIPGQTMKDALGGLFVNPDYQIQSAQRGGKLYIADYGGDVMPVVAQGAQADGAPVPNITGGTSSNSTLTHSSENFLAAGVNDIKEQLSVKLTNCATSGMYNDTYTVSSVTATTVVLDGGWNGDGMVGADGDCDYRIERHPKIYNPVDNTVSLWLTETPSISASGGINTNNNQVPIGCPAIAVYRDRLVLAGAASDPHVWYMSRQGDPLDWIYSDDDTDPQRAVAGTDADAGQIGEPITALIATSDDYMIIATRSDLWILRGDPAFGGQFDNLSRNIGVIQKGAWCYGPEGHVIFLSRDGLYVLPPGPSVFPQSISAERLPGDLRIVDTNIVDVAMAYDVQFRGVHIFVARRDVDDVTQTTHWWLDWELTSYWPCTMFHEQQPSSIIQYESDSVDNATVILGTRGSKLYKFDAGQPSDEGIPFANYVVLGPLAIGDGSRDGLLRELVGVMGRNGAPVTWEIYSDQTAESAVERATAGTSPDASGTFVEDLNPSAFPRERSSWLCFRIIGSLGVWAVERIHAIVKLAGYRRIGF